MTQKDSSVSHISHVCMYGSAQSKYYVKCYKLAVSYSIGIVQIVNVNRCKISPACFAILDDPLSPAWSRNTVMFPLLNMLSFPLSRFYVAEL